jgi:Mlc titration factor MtfA (ptsG expression regulator)
MSPIFWIIGLGALGVFVLAWRRHRRETVGIDASVPVAEWLDADLPWRGALDSALRRRHEKQTRSLLRRIRFYGCQGQHVDERMRVLLAGLACLLTLRRNGKVYPDLRSVLVYPAAFWVRHELPDEYGLVPDDEILQLGESQAWGRVVLSWEDVQSALAGDAVNVAVHEFAHQLDEEVGGGEGAPAGADPQRWPEVMRAEYARLEAQASPALDDYGLEGPAEFFAVATEAFFQRPDTLRENHSALYALLVDYYGADYAGRGLFAESLND